MTAYVPNHTSAQIPSIVIDFMVEFGVQIIAFVGLIALVGLYVWFRSSTK